MLAFFYLLYARDLNEAIQLASRNLPARYGNVEVRPCASCNPLEQDRPLAAGKKRDGG